jgi:membrane-bound metal-dependent hydrolase YbcI (DUF457 family)
MTPAGHLSISYISGSFSKKIYILPFVIGGVLPDIDFILIFFKWFNQVHRVITHNLLFIVLIALFGSFLSFNKSRKIVALSLFLGGFLHLMIDSCMDNNPSNGIGIALFWPFSDKFFSPFNIYHTAESNPGWNEPIKMFKALAPLMIYEIAFYIIAIFILLKNRAKQFTLH